jgi:hypothetical protein
MVNLDTIFKALKKVLTDDNSLMNLIKEVYIGNEMPNYIPPCVQIPLMSDEMNNVTEESEITFYINIYSHSEPDGNVDTNEISAIAAIIKGLINNQSLTVTGHRVFSMYMEGQNPPIKDLRYPKNHIGSIRCRMFAINLS